MDPRKVETPSGAVALALVALLSACSSGSLDEDKEEAGPDSFSGSLVDARLIADVYTWSCVDANTGTTYQGAFGQEATLEYAPGGIQALQLPDPGECVAGLNMFPDNAGPDAIDIPGIASDPKWESDVQDGTLRKQASGYYFDEVYPDVRTCYSTDEVMAGGITLVDAGRLNGAATPLPNEAPTVDFSSSGTSIEFGDTVSMDWGSHLWDEVFVQVRREKEGDAWESVTCNATGLEGFTVDAEIWGLMDERIAVDQNNLYVGFQTLGRESVSGNDVQVITRAIALAAVED
jgi:hypothetical protein